MRREDDLDVRMLSEKQRQAVEANSGAHNADLYGPYHTEPSSADAAKTLFAAGESPGDSTAALPLVPHQGGTAGESPWDTDDEAKSYVGSRAYDGEASTIGAPSTIMFANNQSNMFAGERPAANAYTSEEPQSTETIETVRQTNKRRVWTAMTWAVSWWIPGFLLKHVGRMKRKDVQMAWREKVLIK